MEDVIFIDSMEPEETEKRNQVRLSLFELVGRHHAAEQKKRGEIILMADKLEKMREEIEKQRMAAQKDREAYEKHIRELTTRFERVRQNTDARVREMHEKIERQEM